MKLLAIATHPIQYQAPWFRALAASPRLDLVVAFGLLPSPREQSVGFGVPFTWDVPVLEGYRWIRLEPSTARPALDRFCGLRTRDFPTVLAAERPDVVLVTGWNSWLLLQGVAAARRRGLPVLVRGESNDLRPRPGPVRRLQRAHLSRFQAYLAIGVANRRFLAARGVAAEKIFDTPYFVDNQRFATQAALVEESRDRLRSAWNVAAGSTCVLFAGKMIGKKRPLELVEALARARSAGASLHLLVAGSGDLRGDTEGAARAAGVPSTFLGFLNQTEIARAYVAADLLALPSDAGETWGLVVNEAMACGRAAVVSDLVGCREDLISEGETGWSYPCGDVGALASILRRAADDRAKLAAMGERARGRVLEGYSVERAVEGTLRACDFVTGGVRR